MSQNGENHPSMSTQEKALMAREGSNGLQENKTVSAASTVKNIASDLLELHMLENNGTFPSKTSTSKHEADSIAQEIAVDLIEFEVKKSGSKVFSTISKIDEVTPMRQPSERLEMSRLSENASESGQRISMIERGLQFKTYFC